MNVYGTEFEVLMEHLKEMVYSDNHMESDINKNFSLIQNTESSVIHIKKGNSIINGCKVSNQEDILFEPYSYKRDGKSIETHMESNINDLRYYCASLHDKEKYNLCGGCVSQLY